MAGRVRRRVGESRDGTRPAKGFPLEVTIPPTHYRRYSFVLLQRLCGSSSQSFLSRCGRSTESVRWPVNRHRGGAMQQEEQNASIQSNPIDLSLVSKVLSLSPTRPQRIVVRSSFSRPTCLRWQKPRCTRPTKDFPLVVMIPLTYYHQDAFALSKRLGGHGTRNVLSWPGLTNGRPNRWPFLKAWRKKKKIDGKSSRRDA
jgi:hypothetical protein